MTTLLLPVAALLLLYIPPIQHAATQWTATWLTQRIGIKVEVESVRLQIPLRIRIEGLHVGTLLGIESLGTDIRLRPLMKGIAMADYVSAQGISIRTDTSASKIQANVSVQKFRADNIAYHLHERKAYAHHLSLADGYVLLHKRDTSEKKRGQKGFPLSLSVSDIQLLRIGADYLDPRRNLQGEAERISLHEAVIDTATQVSLRSAEIIDGALTLKQSDMIPWEITELTMRADSLQYTPSGIAGQLTRLAFKEAHGIDLQEAKMMFAWQEGVLSVPQLTLRTEHSSLSGHLSSEGYDTGNTTIDGKADIFIGYADAQRWAQWIDDIPQEVLRLYPTETLSASVSLTGSTNQLRLHRCHLSLPTAFDIDVTGMAQNITFPKQRSALCHIEATTYDLDFLTGITNGMSGKRIVIPPHITLCGDINYAPDTMHAHCSFGLDKGRVIVEGGYRPKSKAFALFLQTDSLDIKQIAPDEEMGTVSLQAHLEGNNLDYRQDETIIHGGMRIQSLQWSGRTFSNATVQASTANGRLLAHATCDDSLMQWSLTTSIRHSHDAIKARLSIQIDDIDLMALQIAEADIHPALQCRSTLDIRPDSAYLLHCHFSNISLRTATQRIQTQALNLQAELTTDTTLLSISSGDLTFSASAHIEGLPWQREHSSFPSGSRLTDYFSHVQAQLLAGDDNPVSNYLSLMGIKYSAIHATINEWEDTIAGHLTIGGIVSREISTDSIGITARYSKGALHAHLQSGTLKWNTQQMQLQGQIDATASWSNTFVLDSLSGQVNLSNVRYSIPAYSLYLRSIDTLTIPFERGGLTITSLPLYTTGAQPLLLDGRITFFGNTPTIQVRLTARNTNLLQAQPTPESLLYGKALVNGNVTISGPFNTLSIAGELKLLPASSIHYIYRDAILTAGNQLSNVVTFVSFEADTLSASTSRTILVTKGISMNLNLTITPTAQLEVSLGANKQNDIKIQGGGTLNIQYVPATGMRLSGRYTIEAGELNMNVPLLHVSHMAIRPGSAITWSGNPQNPQLNITAEERIRASVTLDGSPQSVLFVTGVSLTDTMEKLNVQFTLTSPENASMQNTLASLSPEERGKLSVALLTTGLYLGEGGTGNLMNTALMSILQSQLDDISRDAFRTVDVSVGIEPLPDGVSGISTRTDYSFSVAKRLWNNRIRIIIGGSVTTSNERIEDNAVIDNISVEWRISPIGNQYLRFFYDKNYESILEGEIRETGVGYAYRRSF